MLGAANELDPLAKLRCGVAPRKGTKPGDSNAIDERSGGLCRGPRATHALVEFHVAESAFESLDDVASLAVPHESVSGLYGCTECCGHFVGIDACRKAQAGVLAIAIYVGRHDERFVGQRIVFGNPRAHASAQLKLTGLAAPHSKPVGICQHQHCASAIGVDCVEVEADAHSLSYIARPADQAIDGATVGSLVALASHHHADAQRHIAGQLVGAPTQNVAVVEQRGDYTGQRLVGRTNGVDNHSREARMRRNLEHCAAHFGDALAGIERAE